MSSDCSSRFFLRHALAEDFLTHGIVWSLLDIASVLSCPLTFFKDTHTHTLSLSLSHLFFSVVLGLHCSVSFSLVVESRGYSLVVLGLLIALASLVTEHGLWGTQASGAGARGLSSCCSWASEHKLSSCGPGA